MYARPDAGGLRPGAAKTEGAHAQPVEPAALENQGTGLALAGGAGCGLPCRAHTALQTARAQVRGSMHVAYTVPLRPLGGFRASQAPLGTSHAPTCTLTAKWAGGRWFGINTVENLLLEQVSVVH